MECEAGVSRAEFEKTVVKAAPGKPIQPFPSMPASMLANPSAREERSNFWMEMQEWVKALEDRLKELENKAAPTQTMTAATSQTLDQDYILKKIYDLELALAATSAGPNGPYHRFKADGTLQLKNPSTGLYYTVLGYDGLTLSFSDTAES